LPNPDRLNTSSGFFIMNFNYLHITYAEPSGANPVEIKYKLRDTSITKKWAERVLAAQQQGYSVDDPGRFYGFGSIQDQTTAALTDINNLIDHLNHWTTIDYRLQFVSDQDTLNKLHHIFEIEHGLLDQKDSDSEYKQSLCDLNLLVHRCESIARGAHPRHVVTYFGLPKIETLEPDDYKCFESSVKFGTVYINYVEIGKTLFDLMMDNDSYIDPAAFQPFWHYSADFVVRFWDDDNSDLENRLRTYYNQHQDFFMSIGYTWNSLAKSIGSIPVADLEYTGNILKELETKQFVKAVDFS
jgi:hypothetical protein